MLTLRDGGGSTKKQRMESICSLLHSDQKRFAAAPWRCGFLCARMNDYSSCRRWCSFSLQTGNDRCCYVHLSLSLGSQSQAKLVSRDAMASIHYERNRDGGIMWWAVIARRDAADAGQMVSHPALTGTGSAALMCRPDRGGLPVQSLHPLAPAPGC
jgi:hypothetical protein